MQRSVLISAALAFVAAASAFSPASLPALRSTRGECPPRKLLFPACRTLVCFLLPTLPPLSCDAPSCRHRARGHAAEAERGIVARSYSLYATHDRLTHVGGVAARGMCKNLRMQQDDGNQQTGAKRVGASIDADGKSNVWAVEPKMQVLPFV